MFAVISDIRKGALPKSEIVPFGLWLLRNSFWFWFAIILIGVGMLIG